MKTRYHVLVKRNAAIGRVLVALGLLFYSCWTTLALAQNGAPRNFELIATMENPFPGPPGYFGGEFGSSLSLLDGILLAGAPQQDTAVLRGGTAYLFRTATGDLLHVLDDPTPSVGENFGLSVAIAGTAAVVGAPFDDSVPLNGGAAYVFSVSGGDLLLELLGETSTDEFGSAVAASEDKFVVGAPDADGANINDGTVGLYDIPLGIQTQLFIDPNSAAFGEFGETVAMSGDLVFIGNSLADIQAVNDGAVYAFDAVGGNLKQTFLNPEPGSPDGFGSAVATDGERVLISAPGRDVAGFTDAGTVYLFDVMSGRLLRTFIDPNPTPFDSFGARAIDVEGDTIAIGDSGGLASNTRAVYVFDALSGELMQTVAAPEPFPRDLAFGGALDLDGDTLAISAARAVVQGNNASGIVYLFERPSLTHVRIDVKPGSEIDPINRKSRGVIPVAILGAESFAVTDVDVTTLQFGPGGATPVHKLGGHFQYVDGDAFLDLLSHFDAQESGNSADNTEACLTGELIDGTRFEGCDTVQTVPPAN